MNHTALRVIDDAPDPMYTTPTRKQQSIYEKRKFITESIHKSMKRMEGEDEIITIISTIRINAKKYYFTEIREKNCTIKKMILADKEFLDELDPSVIQDYKRKLDI